MIDTGDNIPVKQRPYNTPYHFRTFEKEHMEELLKNKVIRPSASPWASPVVIAPKKGGWRFCVNYQALNKLTKTDAYPIPRINNLLDQVQKAKYFTSLDAFTGFHGIPVHPESISKTAFVTSHGQWEYVRMPFGLKNAPAAFQRTMNTILSPVLNKFAVVYIDDINIYSDSFKQHLDHLR